MNSLQIKRKRQFPGDFLLHVHPRIVPLETLRFTLTFGLGGMATTLILLLFITGFLQKLSYTPDTESAYQSIQFMYAAGNFAGWLRNIHYWSGNLLVIVTFLHFCRVFLTGGFSNGRRLNWIIGLLLLGLVFFSNFSGYLLPWDQLAFWAVTIFINMIAYIPLVGQTFAQLLRGGSEIGATTLTNFYALHTGILPTVLLVLAICHFWLIRKARGLVRQGGKQSSPVTVEVMPNLIVREAAVALSLVGLVMLFSALIDAPLSEAATPGVSPNPAKAAWFFLGLQELLMHLHPVFAICVFPVLVFLCLVSMPYWNQSALAEGVWFGGDRGKKLAFVTSTISVVLTVVVVILDDMVANLIGRPVAGIFTRGIVPLVAVFTWYCLGYSILTSKFRYNRGEAVMAGFIFMVILMICLTVIGIWFRGPGMQLVFPFK
jgi:quinol-cytochrome oxidoreductase complex cytochrome b subunit